MLVTYLTERLSLNSFRTKLPIFTKFCVNIMFRIFPIFHLLPLINATWQLCDCVGQEAFNVYLFISLFTLTANGFLPGGSGTTIRHNTPSNTSHKLTHHPQTEHITQNYTNNEGQTTHNEYNANTITTTIDKKITILYTKQCTHNVGYKF
jgi:hypothetical protein